MRRSAVAAAAAVGDSLPSALLFPFKSKRFKEGFRGGFRVSRNFTSSFSVPSGNLGFRRQEQQQQESRKGPTFLASSFRKSLLLYYCCQVNPEPEQTTATSVDQDPSTGGLPAIVPVEESGAGNSKVNGQFSESRVALSLSLWTSKFCDFQASSTRRAVALHYCSSYCFWTWSQSVMMMVDLLSRNWWICDIGSGALFEAPIASSMGQWLSDIHNGNLLGWISHAPWSGRPGHCSQPFPSTCIRPTIPGNVTSGLTTDGIGWHSMAHQFHTTAI
jgi:hypothetical protein